MKLIRLSTPAGRFYYPENGPVVNGSIFLYPSVTTVLKNYNADNILEIEKSIGKEKLDEIKENAANRGSVMHLYLENFLNCLRKTNDLEKCLKYTQLKTINDLKNTNFSPTQIKIGRDLFYNFYYEGYFDNIERVLFTEKFIYSKSYCYAGTLDFAYLDKNGYYVIVDFKSASSVRDTTTIDKYFMQGSAYSIAFEECFNKKVNRVEIWVSTKFGINNYILSSDNMVKKRNEYIHWVDEFNKSWDPMEIISKYYK